MRTQTPILTTDRDLDRVASTVWQHVQEIDPECIRPLLGRVLIKDVHDETKAGSIFLPEDRARQDRERWGVVVAVGLGDKWIERDKRGPYGVIVKDPLPDGLDRYPMECRVGDRVIYQRRRESEFEIRGVRYTVGFETQIVRLIDMDSRKEE